MSKAPDLDTDVTGQEIPALRRPPFDERLPRLNCAPSRALLAGSQHQEKTLIGEIPALPLDEPQLDEPAAASVAKVITTRPMRRRSPPVTWDRWLLLALASATLFYTVYGANAARSAPPQASPQSTTSAAIVASSAPQIAKLPVANPIAAPHAARPASTALRASEPSERAPLEQLEQVEQLETRAAQAWLAGHTQDATQLYRQLAHRSPAPPFAAAVTILEAQSATQREAMP